MTNFGTPSFLTLTVAWLLPVMCGMVKDCSLPGPTTEVCTVKSLKMQLPNSHIIS